MPRRNGNARKRIYKLKLPVKVLLCRVHCKAFEKGEKVRAVAEYIAQGG